MAIPTGYRLLTSADVGKTFGVDLEPRVFIDTTVRQATKKKATTYLTSPSVYATNNGSIETLYFKGVSVADTLYTAIGGWGQYLGWKSANVASVMAMDFTETVSGWSFGNQQWLYVKDKLTVNMTSPNGVTLATEGKLCDKNIEVVPALQKKSVTENGDVVADSGYAGLSKVSVNVTPALQEKTATPIDSVQEIVPDEGYDGLSKVTVEAASGGSPINGVIESYKVNAGATVSAGDFVEFVTHYGGGNFGSAAAPVSSALLSTNRVLVAYVDSSNSNYGTAVILTVNETGVTIGEKVVFNTTATTGINTVALTESKVAVVYANNSNYGKAVLLTVDGTTITVGTDVVWNSSTINNLYAVKLNENKILMAYNSAGSSSFQQGVCRILSVDGEAISAGSTYALSATTSARASSKFVISTINEDKAVVIFNDGGDSYKYKARVLTINGTSVGRGTPLEMGENLSSTFIVALSADRAICFRGETADVLEISDTTLSILSSSQYFTYTASGGSAGGIDAVLLNDSKVLVIRNDYDGSTFYSVAVVVTINGTEITSGARVRFSNYVVYETNISLVAFSDSSVLATYIGSGGQFSSLTIDGMTVTADSSTLGTYVQPATSRLHNVGIAKTDGTEGETVEVYCASIAKQSTIMNVLVSTNSGDPRSNEVIIDNSPYATYTYDVSDYPDENITLDNSYPTVITHESINDYKGVYIYNGDTLIGQVGAGESNSSVTIPAGTNITEIVLYDDN